MKKNRRVLGALLAIAITLLTACSSSGTPSNTSHVTPTTAPSHEAVQVTLLDNKIESSRTTFIAGRPYVFVVTNQGTSPHDFIIDTRVDGPAPGGVPDRILYIINSTQLPPGATKSFTFSFPLSDPKQAVQFNTHLAGPNGAGVLLPVDIKRG